VPTEKVGKNITGQLNYLGIEAQFMTSKDLDLNSKGVKVCNASLNLDREESVN
jgi:hypothetical protein